MAECPRCGGAMHEAGFSKVVVDQNCPDCGRFRKLHHGDVTQWYCETCETYEDLEKMVKLYVCGHCKALRREDQL